MYRPFRGLKEGQWTRGEVDWNWRAILQLTWHVGIWSHFTVIEGARLFLLPCFLPSLPPSSHPFYRALLKLPVKEKMVCASVPLFARSILRLSGWYLVSCRQAKVGYIIICTTTHRCSEYWGVYCFYSAWGVSVVLVKLVVLARDLWHPNGNFAQQISTEGSEPPSCMHVHQGFEMSTMIWT